jgi:hypothetical protein
MNSDKKYLIKLKQKMQENPELKNKILQRNREKTSRYRHRLQLKQDYITPHEKQCSICKKIQSSQNFNPSKSQKSGLRSECKDCTSKRNIESYYRLGWGMTLAEVNTLKEKQSHRCACCEIQPPKLVIDHNHKTGIIRELLCEDCNKAIGYLRDSEEKASKVVIYLARHRWTNDPSVPGRRCRDEARIKGRKRIKSTPIPATSCQQPCPV